MKDSKTQLKRDKKIKWLRKRALFNDQHLHYQSWIQETLNSSQMKKFHNSKLLQRYFMSKETEDALSRRAELKNGMGGNWSSKSDQEPISSRDVSAGNKNFHNDCNNIMRKKRCGFYKARCREKIYHASLLWTCWLLNIFLWWKWINQQLKLQQSNISQQNMQGFHPAMTYYLNQISRKSYLIWDLGQRVIKRILRAALLRRIWRFS